MRIGSILPSRFKTLVTLTTLITGISPKIMYYVSTVEPRIIPSGVLLVTQNTP